MRHVYRERQGSLVDYWRDLMRTVSVVSSLGRLSCKDESTRLQKGVGYSVSNGNDIAVVICYGAFR
jgi:hypothetical protein